MLQHAAAATTTVHPPWCTRPSGFEGLADLETAFHAAEADRPLAQGLLVGSQARPLHQRGPIGFGGRATPEDDDLLFDDGEAHGLVVAPTGAGKTTWLACQLARHRGSAIVFDPKGELVAMTARRRRALGNDVVVLDPFGVTADLDLGLRPGALDPVDALRGSDSLEDDAMAIAADLQHQPETREPFWPQTAADLTAGLIVHAGRRAAPERRTWDRVVSLLFDADLDQELAAMLDGQRVEDETARLAFQTYLSHPEQNTRPSVLSSARAAMRAFKTPAVRRATQQTSFSLDGFVDGSVPATIYIVLPPRYLQSHGALVRLWLGTLLRVLTAPASVRARAGGEDVLVLVDELPTLGPMPLVPSLFAFMRSFGVRAVAIVQSLAQLDACYGQEARVIRENAGLRLAFGVSDRDQAEPVARMLDTTPEQLLDLGPDEALVRSDGATRRCHRATHLDPTYVPPGWFDVNPFHLAGPSSGIGR